MAADEFVQVKDLPQSVFEAIHRDIREHTVAFVDHREDDPNWAPRLIGSGVLVVAGGRKAILTADHVLQVLPRGRRLCVLLERTDHPHTLDPSAVGFLSIARGPTKRTVRT